MESILGKMMLVVKDAKVYELEVLEQKVMGPDWVQMMGPDWVQMMVLDWIQEMALNCV